VEVLPPFTAKTLVLRMLKEHNILMRDCSGKGGFDNKQYMRIAVRDHDDNARLIESLRMIGEGL
jgi:histidinol-phosphate/aromatic aminotransferase/cobyric acid decarboxylase-like protein